MSPLRLRILPVVAVLLVTAGAVRAGNPDGDVQTGMSAPPESRVGFQFNVGIFAGNFNTTPSADNDVTITTSSGLEIKSLTSTAGTGMILSPTEAVWNLDLNAFAFESATVQILAHTVSIKQVTSTISSSSINDTNPANDTAISSIKISGKLDENKDPGTQTDYGHPVSAFSGGFHMTEPHDLNLGGPGPPIFFQRHYDSKLLDDGEVHSALGPNWQHNYDLSLSTNGTNAIVVFREGRILRFENDGADWNILFRADIPFRLVETGSEFVLADPRSQFMYFFDINGLLARIEDGRGNTNSLTYDGALLTNVTDSLNRTLSFLYDTNDLLASVSDGQRTVQYDHTDSNLTSFVDASGETYTYTYDPTSTNSPALMTSHTSPEGNTPITSVFDAEGRVTRQTNGAGNTSAMAYDLTAAGRVHTYTNALGGTQIHVHNENGELSRLTDEAGDSIIVQSDAAGRRNRVTDRRGQLTRITYDNASGLPTKIDLQTSPNLDEFFFYTARTNNGGAFFDLTRNVHPDSTTNSYGYDALGNLIVSTNRVGDVWGYGYNARGQVLTATNPVGGELTFTYDANARLASATDSDTGVTTYEYDSLNRLTNVTHPNPDTIQYTYDAVNRLTSVTDERGNTTAFEYDRNSRLTNVTDALNQTARFEYDAMDRLTRVVDRLGHGESIGYDPRTDPVSLPAVVTNRNGFVTRFEYDERRFLTGVVDPAEKTNSFGYDPEGSILSAGNPLGETFSFQRDPMGYVIGVTDPLGNNVGVLRDNMKRVTRLTDPLGRKTSYGYDPRGLLTNATRELGISAGYSYSPLGLITNIVDPDAGQWSFVYTSAGRPIDLSDPLSRQTSYAYDTRGRLGAVTFADGVTLTNTYDGADNLTRRQFSDGTDLEYAFDPLNRLTNIVGQASSLSLSYDAENRITNSRQAGLDFGAGYDADGRLTSVGYSNGLCVVTYTYDSRDRLIHVNDNLTGQGMDFSYDDAHRLTGITRSNGVTGTYTYDARSLLARIQEGSIVDVQYTIDAAGQVIEADYVTVPIDPLSALTNDLADFSYDLASQVNSVGYQYDPRGRLTNAPNTDFTWDGASRLRAIDNVTYTYNALSDLETRAESGATHRYFYNYAVGMAPIMAERNDNTGQFTRFYVWTPNGFLLYLIDLPGTTISYPLFDRVGTTLALTDGLGAVTDSYAYDPYGRVLSQTGTNTQPFRFNGRFGVRADGLLYHMRARWYEPASARFISKEPVWPELANPKKLNPYQFALHGPLTFLDPTGTYGENPDLDPGLVRSFSMHNAPYFLRWFWLALGEPIDNGRLSLRGLGRYRSQEALSGPSADGPEFELFPTGGLPESLGEIRTSSPVTFKRWSERPIAWPWRPDVWAGTGKSGAPNGDRPPTTQGGGAGSGGNDIASAGLQNQTLGRTGDFGGWAVGGPIHRDALWLWPSKTAGGGEAGTYDETLREGSAENFVFRFSGPVSEARSWEVNVDVHGSRQPQQSGPPSFFTPEEFAAGAAILGY